MRHNRKEKRKKEKKKCCEKEKNSFKYFSDGIENEEIFKLPRQDCDRKWLFSSLFCISFFFLKQHFKLTDMANLFVDLGDSQTDNDLLT